MTKQEEVQFKVLALQASAGDIDKAKLVFEWLVENSVDDAVAYRFARQEQLAASQTNQQLGLFDGQ